jgi:hypothetical protein
VAGEPTARRLRSKLTRYTVATRRSTLVIIALCGWQLLFAGDSLAERETLRDLKSIGVMIGLERTIQEAGVTVDMLRPDVEAKLRRANVRVIPRAQLLERDMRDPTLIVNFSGTTKSGDILSSTMELLLRQRVSPKSSQISTWSVSRAGSIRTGETAKIRNVVNASVDDFIKACSSVNVTR